MGKYIVEGGQNLYDISMHLYGSIEGVTDLLVSNESLSLETKLKAGDELVYSEDYIVSSDIVQYLKNNSIKPNNDERNVYYNQPSYSKIAIAILPRTQKSVGVLISGSGIIQIDWGDNTAIQTVNPSSQIKNIQHNYADKLIESANRKVQVYSDNANIIDLDISSLKPLYFYLLKELSVESLISKSNAFDIGFTPLLSGIYNIDLSGSSIKSLLPLISNGDLMTLNLSSCVISQNAVDEYLKQLIKQYGTRRNCTVTLNTAPTGVYQEPVRDLDLNYVISSGMEAIWVIVHELAWNEGGKWKFIINDTIYINE